MNYKEINNNPIIDLLYKNAPGTFHHSIRVSGLAEKVALSINADFFLTKIGGIYHDIGKIKNSEFFIENQYNKINPHKKISPKKSADIILKHVSTGIQLAKEYNLPNSIIDFIRTHHGNSLINFFYNKEKKLNIISNKNKFQYPGPKPFSKEMAIVMLADSLEAASKSIFNLSFEKIDYLVDKILYKKIVENQFSNINLSKKEFKKIKQSFKKELKKIFL